MKQYSAGTGEGIRISFSVVSCQLSVLSSLSSGASLRTGNRLPSRLLKSVSPRHSPQRLKAAVDSAAVAARVELVPFPKPTRSGVFRSLLRTFLRALPRQVFHLFLIDLEAVGFFHVLRRFVTEQAEQIVLLGFEQRLANFVFLGGKLLIGGSCLSRSWATAPLPAARIGPLISPVSGKRWHWRCSSNRCRDLPIGRNQVARFHRRTQFLGRFFQIVVRFGAVGKFLRLLVQQKSGTFVFELRPQPSNESLRTWASRRPNGKQLEHYVALRDLHHIGRSLFRFAKNGIHKLRTRPDSGKVIAAAEEVGGGPRSAPWQRPPDQILRCAPGEQSVRRHFGGMRYLLLFNLLFDLALDLGERLEVGFLLSSTRMM